MSEKRQTSQTCCSQPSENFASLLEMVRRQELQSLQKGEFMNAEEAKNKFSRLKEQQARQKQELLLERNKQNIKEVERLGQIEVLNFQRQWQVKLRQHIDQAKRHEEALQTAHDRQLENFSQQLCNAPGIKIKYSPQVLTLRKNLDSLIRVRDYKQAENVKQVLASLEEEQAVIWSIKLEEKKKHKYEQLLKKQENEFKALRTKLQTQFNEKIKQREVKFHILLKKNQKRRIEQGKLNQSNLLEVSRDLSRTMSTINRPNKSEKISKSVERREKGLRAWIM